MKTVINKTTGKILYCTGRDFIDTDNEIAIDELLVENFIDAYFNQTTREFYEGASQEEIDSYNNEILIQKKKEANDLLKETDWYVIRFHETGKPIPQEILDLREQIRNQA